MLSPSQYSAKSKIKMIQLDVVNVEIQKIDMPKIIQQIYNNVELGADIMFMNDTPFLTSISNYSA